MRNDALFAHAKAEHAAADQHTLQCIANHYTSTDNRRATREARARATQQAIVAKEFER